MQLRQCYARAKPFRLKKSKGVKKARIQRLKKARIQRISKNPKALKKVRISKSGFKKATLAILIASTIVLLY